MSDWWNQPTRRVRQPEVEAPRERPPACPWCGQPAPPDCATCPSCGAVMAQAEDLGGLAIPGVTVVDPAMQARGYASTAIGSQSRMSTLSLLGGGPGGTVVQMAAATAMLAGDHVRGFGTGVSPDEVGRPSQAALDMVEKLRGSAGESAPAEPVDIWAVPAPAPVPETEPASAEPSSDRPAAEAAPEIDPSDDAH